MPDPAPEPERKKRRLIPDRSDTIEVGAQRLTRVVRQDAPSDTEDSGALSAQSIDDIARKHLGSSEARAIAENSDFLRALVEASEGASPAELITDRIEIVSEGSEAIPSAETDPLKRDEVTMGALIATEDAPDFTLGRSPPKTLLDLFEIFPLDGVNWFIYVVRILPKIFSGVTAHGIVRKITRPLTLDQWQQVYGGGTYQLTVYGPPKRAIVLTEDGRSPSKRMTEPITVTFPGPPSFECLCDLEDSMTQQMADLPRGRGPMTIADASVESKRIDTAADREIRIEAQVKEERARAEKLQQEKQAADGSLLKQVLQAQRESETRSIELQNRLLEREREIADERRLDDEKWEARLRELTAAQKPDDIDRFIRVAQVIKPEGSTEALRAEHTREIERMTGRLSEETRRADERIADERARADRLIEDEKRRCQERIAEVERRGKEYEAEMRARADREIRETKEETERRIGDLHRQYETAKADMDRNHQRDLSSKDATHQMAIETLKSTYDMRLDNAKSEVKRSASDIERYKQEAEAGRDVVGQIAKLKETASALGMVEASESAEDRAPDWKQMLVTSGGAILQKLPELVENIASMTRGKSAQDLEAARAQGRREMVENAGAPMGALPPAHRQRRQLAAPAFQHMSEVSPEPRRDAVGGDPFQVSPAAPSSHAPMPAPIFAPEAVSSANYESPIEVSTAPPTPAAPAPALAPASVAPPAPAHPARVSVPPAPVSSADPAEIAKDREILNGENLLRPQYEAGVTPVTLVQHFAAQFGPGVAAQILSDLGSADRVVLALERSGDPMSPFLTREGKKFLRALFKELERVATK